MTKQQEDQTNQILDTLLTRRSVLIGGIALPAISMLAGCVEENDKKVKTIDFIESNVIIPFGPFSPDDAPQIPQNAPIVPDENSEPIINANATKMNVGIYNFEYNSFKQLRGRRKVAEGTPGSILVRNKDGSSVVYESIIDYVKRSVDNRFVLLYRGMLTAFKTRPPKDYDVSFFTAPEFYWNVPWGEFLNIDEVLVASDLFLKLVTQKVRNLIAKFPECDYGKLILLPGTIAVLKPSVNVVSKDGTAASTKENPIYDASNHLICVHNLPLNDIYQRPAYMIWPKRTVSLIDFMSTKRCKSDQAIPLASNRVNPSIENSVNICKLNPDKSLIVRIQHVASDRVLAFDEYGHQLLDEKFNNELIPGLPFGINICLDHVAASSTNNTYRMAQLKNTKFKLDFVIAAGIGLDEKSYTNSTTVQYAIHNDGIQGSNQNSEQLKDILYSNVSQVILDQNAKSIRFLTLPALKISENETNKHPSIIKIDNSTDFSYPDRYSGMPSIIGQINPANVRVWNIPVDVKDTLTTHDELKKVISKKCISTFA